MWPIALAPWSGVAAIWLVIRYLTRRAERQAGPIEALADAVREPRPTLADITAAPGQVTWPCGCTPCAPHAAEITAREKARAVIAARDAWAAEWNERLRRP